LKLPKGNSQPICLFKVSSDWDVAGVTASIVPGIILFLQYKEITWIFKKN
jgi:hypothetical protein